MSPSPRGRQLNLLPPPSLEHGGTTRQGRRKIRRPFDPSRSLHLVMRSSRARGDSSFRHRRNRSRVEALFYDRAARAGIKVYRLVNVGNHLHALIKAPTREALQAFLRIFAGLAARLVTGAKKGLGLRKRASLSGDGHGAVQKEGLKPRFWDAPAYTRVVHWGRHYAATLAYLAKNRLDAVGFGGARLRIRADGAPLVVFGGTEGLDRQTAAAVEALIKGKPG